MAKYPCPTNLFVDYGIRYNCCCLIIIFTIANSQLEIFFLSRNTTQLSLLIGVKLHKLIKHWKILNLNFLFFPTMFFKSENHLWGEKMFPEINTPVNSAMKDVFKKYQIPLKWVISREITLGMWVTMKNMFGKSWSHRFCFTKTF